MKQPTTTTNPHIAQLYEIFKSHSDCFLIDDNQVFLTDGWNVIFEPNKGTTTCLNLYLADRLIRSFETVEQVQHYIG